MNCTKCARAIHDTVWNDHRCSIYKHTVSNREIVGCKMYKKGVPMNKDPKDRYKDES